MKFEELPPSDVHIENMETEKEMEYRKRTLEQLVDFVQNYDYENFSESVFLARLEQQQFFYTDGDDEHAYSVKSFERLTDLEPIWSALDSKLVERIILLEFLLPINSIERKLIDTGDFRMNYDGVVIPFFRNPVVLGGVHGDEPGLPTQIAALSRHNDVTGEFHLDHERSYLNSNVNYLAGEKQVRGYSADADSDSEGADINRSDVDDSVSREIRKHLLETISTYPQPFILDMHNDTTNQRETLPFEPKTSPHAFTFYTDTPTKVESDNQLLAKIFLARELGIHRLTLVDRQLDPGVIIGAAMQENALIDGMVIEVDINDKKQESSRIALQFLVMNQVVNNGRPSISLQLRYEFGQFYPGWDAQHPELPAVFKYTSILPEEMTEATDNVEFQVINGVPIKMERVDTDDFVSSLVKKYV